MREPGKSPDIIQPFGLTRDYGLYWSGSLSVAVGLWVQRLIVAWLTWEITGSGFWLGLVATIDLMMSIFLGPIAGLLADRYDRKRMTCLCQSANIVIVLALAFLLSSGQLDQYDLLAFAMVNGVVSGIQQPIRMSLTATLVAKPQIPRAVTYMAINAHLARFVAPLIVGPVLAFGETLTAFFASAGLYGVMVVLLPFINVGDQSRPLKEWSGWSNEFATGFKFATGHPAVGPVIFAFLLLSVFGRPIFELLPGLADGLFSRGASGFSWIAAMVGAATVLACLWQSYRPHRHCSFASVMSAMLAFSIAAIALSAAPNFWIAVILATIAAFAATASTISGVSVIQTSVPDEIRGRVMGIYGTLYRAAPAIGAIAMGWASDFVGLRWPIAIGATVCLVWWFGVQIAKPRPEASTEGGD